MKTVALVILFVLFLGTLDVTSANRERRQSQNLKVTTILVDPFLKEVANPKNNLRGNDRYTGYIKDLLDLVAKELKVSYTLNLVADGKYGGRDRRTGKWNGMVGELVDKTADVAAAPLTITAVREQVIDFTTPYMTLGLTIMMNKQDVTSVVEDGANAMFFLKPFTYSVWICLAVAVVATTIIFYLINRFDPYESGKHCKGKPCEGENFNVLGSLWFVCGGLTLQGYSKRPRSAAAFVLSAIWWSFSVIILATYIMGIVSTQARAMFAVPGLKVRSLQDLLDQNETQFGTVESGSSMQFFQSSAVEVYKKAYQKMVRDDSFITTTLEGTKKVEKGGYAFLGESTIIDFTVGRKCNLVKVGGRMNEKGYGLAFANGSPQTARMSNALLKLTEKGDLTRLKQKWWPNSLECKEGNEIRPNMFIPSESPKFTSLTTINLTTSGGIFIYLIIGICLSVLTLIIEVVVSRSKKDQKYTPTESGEKNEEGKRSNPMQDIA